MVFQMIAFCGMPFLLPLFFGWSGPLRFAIRVTMIFLILGLGFFTGLLLCFFIQDSSYFQNYEFPRFWVTTFVDGPMQEGGLWKMLLVPYIFLGDLVRVYLHFNFTNFSIALVIPEIVSMITLANFWRALNGLEEIVRPTAAPAQTATSAPAPKRGMSVPGAAWYAIKRAIQRTEVGKSFMDGYNKATGEGK
jgi:hypothetical protein